MFEQHNKQRDNVMSLLFLLLSFSLHRIIHVDTVNIGMLVFFLFNACLCVGAFAIFNTNSQKRIFRCQ